MKALMAHIDSLILEHDCVIIPDFGGFVVNRESSSIDKNRDSDLISPPRLTIGFNPDLRFSDGLLAQSYMNESGIAYDVACKLISDEVKKLQAALSSKETILVGKLGVLSLNTENQLIFAPRKFFYHPSIFGYSPIVMKSIGSLVPQEKEEEEKESPITLNPKNNALRRIIGGVTVAAAVVLVFFASSTHISQNTNHSIQKASFFTENNATNEIVEKNPGLNKSSEKLEKKDSIVVVEKTVVTPVQESPSLKPVARKPFHVIAASSPSKVKAQGMLDRLKNDFPEATLLESSAHYRVVVASFDNKPDANTYLLNLREMKPQYKDAWVFTDN